MWIATQQGFYSIVLKERAYHVRARSRQDLENLNALLDAPREIHEWPGADYRYRILVENLDELETLLTRLARNLDYSNFKTRISTTPDQRSKLAAYHDLWANLAEQRG